MPASEPSTSMQSRNALESADGKLEEDDDAASRSVELPLHLTEHILFCISPIESARLATVCKSWAATVSDRLARPLVPHLFVTRTDNMSVRRGFVVPVPLDGAVSGDAAIPARASLADLVRQWLRCHGATPCGLLALASADSNSILLVNPVTDEVQQFKVAGSWHALLASGGGDYLFLCFDVRLNGLMLWTREGPLKAWSSRRVYPPNQGNNILSAAICNDCIYVLEYDNKSVSKIDTSKSLLLMKKLPVASVTEHFATPRDKPSSGSHLIESAGQILFVRQLLAHTECAAVACTHGEFLRIVGFEVYRLEEAAKRWTLVEKLAGDQALFVSPDSSFAVSASEMAGCRSNYIYFVGDMQHCSLCGEEFGSTWGMYSMEDRKVIIENAVSKFGRHVEARWFLPRVR